METLEAEKLDDSEVLVLHFEEGNTFRSIDNSPLSRQQHLLLIVSYAYHRSV